MRRPLNGERYAPVLAIRVVRELVGFLLAPWIAVFFWLFTASLSFTIRVAIGTLGTTLENSFLLAMTVAYAPAIVLGLPAYLVLRKFEIFTLVNTLLIGVVISCIVMAMTGAVVSSWFIPILSGAVGGGVFWLVVGGTKTSAEAASHPTTIGLEGITLAFLLGGAAILFGAATSQDISDSITTSTIEGAYGPILDHAQAMVAVGGNERDFTDGTLQAALIEDDSILQFSIEIGPSIIPAFVYSKIGQPEYGCTGTGDPQQKGILRCTLGSDIFDTSTLMYERNSVHNNEEIRMKIFLDYDATVDRLTKSQVQ